MEKETIPKSAYIKFRNEDENSINATIFYTINNFNEKHNFIYKKDVKFPKNDEAISKLAKKSKGHFTQIIDGEDEIMANLYEFNSLGIFEGYRRVSKGSTENIQKKSTTTYNLKRKMLN